MAHFRIERARLDDYAIEPVPPRTGGGEGGSLHRHTLVVCGAPFSFTAPGRRPWVRSSDRVSFAFQRSGRDRWILLETLRAYSADGRELDLSGGPVRGPASETPAAPPRSVAVRDAIVEELTARSAGLLGEAYLERVVLDLARVLGVRRLYVAEIVADGRRAETLACAVDGMIAANFGYDLAGTPCEKVVEGGPIFIEEGAADRYPEDLLLRELGVQSYFGFPLADLAGNPLGLVVALHDQPLTTDGWMRALFQIFAARLHAEIARMRAERNWERQVDRNLTLLRTLGELALRAHQQQDATPFAQHLTHTLLEVLDARIVGVWFRVPGSPTLRLEAVAAREGQGLPTGTTVALHEEHLQRSERVRVVRREDPALSEEVRAVLDTLDAPGYVEAAIRVAGEMEGAVALVPGGALDGYSEEEAHFIAESAELVTRVHLEERRAAQQTELLATRKAAALSEVAAGIAHDFGNVLGAICALAEMGLDEDPEEARALLDDILEAGERGRALVEQIHRYAAADLGDREPVELGELLRELEGHLRPLSGKVVMRFALPPDPVCVDGDRVQLGQLFQNLALNAIQAMEGEGLLEVTLAPPSGSGEPVEVTVRDTGPGIPAQVLDRIFEPFFTTRKGKDGTGLGLAIIDRVARAHGGSVEVASTSREGTTFAVRLPAGG